MRHQTMQPLSVSGFDDDTAIFGRVIPPIRRGQLTPKPRPRPRLLATLDPKQVARKIVTIFEQEGKEIGLEAAASYKSPIIMDAAVEYLASRRKDADQLEQLLAEIKAQKTFARQTRRKRVMRSLQFRKAFIETRLQDLNAGKKQAVADVPELPVKAGKTPSWVPFLTLGIAIAGFMMAVGKTKK